MIFSVSYQLLVIRFFRQNKRVWRVGNGSDVLLGGALAAKKADFVR